ncbi:MAG: hypothetical protein ACI88C_000001 [Acidimicrobiales bacterium]|jgi:hypothetical protein
MIIYEGPSMLDGQPIVAILTGDKGRGTANRKTGKMGQLWILRAGVSPVEAVKTGADASVCGDCPLRGTKCYVNVGQAPGAVWRAWVAGSYPQDDGADFERPLRMGAYGEPAALPLSVLQNLANRAPGHTGYTHQWRDRPELSGLLMASCETAEDEAQATAAGWRFFSTGPGAGAIQCPADSRGIKCADCKLCNGAGAAKSIWIDPHGAGAAAMLASGARAGA